MKKQTAQTIINDPRYVAAYSQFFRQPMKTDPSIYELAMDWLQAALCLEAASTSAQ